MNESKLQTVITLVPLISATLYLLGYSNHVGYLDEFGIDYSMFELASDRSFFLGYMAYMQSGWIAMVYGLLSVTFFMSMVVFVATLSSKTREKKFLNLVNRITSKVSTDKTEDEQEKMKDRVNAIVVYGGWSLIVPFLLFLLAFFSNLSGHERAQHEMKDFTKNKGNLITLFTPLISKPVPAKQIECSSSHCAFWLGNESIILSYEHIERILVHKSSGH